MGMQHVLDQLDDESVEVALTTLTEGSNQYQCVGLLEDKSMVMLPATHPWRRT